MSNREIFYHNLGLPSTSPLGLEIDRASGIWLYTPEGDRYADLVSGVSVSNVGHCHPKVTDAVIHQATKYMHLMVYGEMIQAPQTILAKKLATLLPDSLDCIYFVNSGSEAIEGAMKLAKRATHRPDVCSFINAYHGGTQGALSILGNETLKQAFRPLLPGVRQLRFNSFADLEFIDERVACVVVEPVQAEAGVILPTEGFLSRLRAKCNETGTLLIFDEIQMGFGRTGKWFAFNHDGVVPDILCIAKAMGGGMPLGAFVASQQLMSKLTNNPVLGHITTFGGHPVSCAAAIAAIEVIESEDLLVQVHEKAEVFANILLPCPVVKEIRIMGLMMAVELFSENQVVEACIKMLARKIITDRFLFHPTAFRIAPPLTITKAECYYLANLILESLNEIE